MRLFQGAAGQVKQLQFIGDGTFRVLQVHSFSSSGCKADGYQRLRQTWEGVGGIRQVKKLQRMLFLLRSSPSSFEKMLLKLLQFFD